MLPSGLATLQDMHKFQGLQCCEFPAVLCESTARFRTAQVTGSITRAISQRRVYEAHVVGDRGVGDLLPKGGSFDQSSDSNIIRLSFDPVDRFPDGV